MQMPLLMKFEGFLANSVCEPRIFPQADIEKVSAMQNVFLGLFHMPQLCFRLKINLIE